MFTSMKAAGNNGAEHIRPFRVGISASFERNTPGLLQPIVDEVFQPYSFVEVEEFEDGTVSSDLIREYDATIADEPTIGPDAFAGAVNTGVIARWGVGYNTIDVEACTEADIALAIATDAVRRPMSEAILTLLLALAKKLPTKDAMVRTGRWDLLSQTIGWGLTGKTVGSIGLGNIATDMFRLLEPFNLGRRIAYDPYISPLAAAAVGVQLVDIETVFRESDFLTINCLLNHETRGIVHRRLLELMKPTAFLINTSRGGLIVEQDLIDVLSERRIAGAGLDVFAHEPLPVDSPLIAMDNVLLAPHGLGYTDDLVREISLSVCNSTLAVLRGEVPRHVVNADVLRRPGFQAKLQGFRRRWETLASTRGSAPIERAG
jgi:phosphoglycerate dehydrogenase-like enzyme